MKKLLAFTMFAAAAFVTPAAAEDQHCSGRGCNNILQQTEVNQTTQFNTVNTKQNQKQQQGQAQGQAQSNNQNVNITGGATNGAGGNVTVSDTNERQVPAIFGPSLVAAPETCMGSMGGNVGTGYFGIGFGSTYKSESCERRMFARTFLSMGMDNMAMAILAQDPIVAKAMKALGLAPVYPELTKAEPEPVQTPRTQNP